jgi:hypothetical protein
MRTLMTGIFGVIVGAGMWRASDGVVGHERSKMLLLVHPDTAAARESVQNLIARYRKTFEQESVLWKTARVCAAPREPFAHTQSGSSWQWRLPTTSSSQPRPS